MSLLQALAPASASNPAPSGNGLLDLLLGNSNPLAQFADSHRNVLGAVGAGLAQGPTFAQGLSNAGQLIPQARALDQQSAQALQAKNATYAYLQANHPDLAAAVQSGLPLQTAWQQALAQDAAANKPQSGFSLSAGQSHYDAKGNLIASVPAGQGSPTYGQSPLILKDPDGKMHTGQMSSAGGVLIDGKTYPSIPNNWTVGTVSQAGGGGLSPEALDIVSTQYLAGDKSAIQGFAKNSTMRAQLANAIAAKANSMGMDGKAIAAEISAYGGNVSAQKTAGTRAAQVGMAASEADTMADIALDASKALPRGNFVPWNQAANAVATGTSSPEMASFVTATTSLVNAYARAVSPLGAPTDAMRQHAEEMLNTAQGPDAYAAVISQMKKEMEAALNAPSEISSRLKQQITGAAPQGVPGQSGGVTSNGVQWSIAP